MRGRRKHDGPLRLVRSPAPKKRRRLKGRPLLFLLFLLLLLGTGLLLSRGFDLLCRVEQIRVTGVARLDEAAIVNRCGVKKGTSLLLLSTRKVEQRVAGLPEICSVAVSREFPNTLAIAVQERAAVATLLAGNCFWLLDGEGVVFAEQVYPAGGLPVITGVAADEIILGEPLASELKREALLPFLESLSGTLAIEVAELNLADPGDLILYTVDRRKVLLGGREKMAQKLDLLQEALARLPGNGAGRCLDLRAGDRLVMVIEKER